MIFGIENHGNPSHYDLHIKNFNSCELKFLIEYQYKKRIMERQRKERIDIYFAFERKTWEIAVVTYDANIIQLNFLPVSAWTDMFSRILPNK